MNKYKKYFPFIAILIFAKFVWLPVLDSRTIQREEIVELEKQILRTQDIINNKEAYLDNIEQLSNTNLELKKHFYTPLDESKFRLDFQKNVESLVVGLDVKIDSISWFEPTQDSLVTWYSLELSFSGSVDSLALIHNKLIASDKWNSISSISWRTESTRGSDWEWRVRSKYRLLLPAIEGGLL